MGRPPKQQLNAYQKRKLKKERNQRNLIEGKFGQAKNAYGLGDIKAKRRDTSESWIGAVFFIMNLITLQKIADIYVIFCALFKNWVSSLFISIAERCFYRIAVPKSIFYRKYQPLKLKLS